MNSATLDQQSHARALERKTSYVVTVQGKLVEFKRWQFNDPPACEKARGVIQTFSPAARLRVLKFLATVDFDYHDFSVFVTLTYPDKFFGIEKGRRNVHRANMLRKIESHLCHQVHGFWKVEWMPRESGSNVGEFMPHVHFLLFGVRFIHFELINRWWKDVIHNEGYVRTEIQRTVNEKQTAFYVAKYIAKTSGIVPFSITHISTIDGRHFGYVRKPNIPRKRKTVLSNLPDGVIRELEALACLADRERPPESDSTFTLLGARSDVARRVISEYLLTQGKKLPQ